MGGLSWEVSHERSQMEAFSNSQPAHRESPCTTSRSLESGILCASTTRIRVPELGATALPFQGWSAYCGSPRFLLPPGR